MTKPDEMNGASDTAFTFSFAIIGMRDDQFVSVTETFNSDGNQNNGRAASSAHGGGAHVAMADGSVHFVTKGVDLQLYRAACTRSGGEIDTIEF